ncbi:hypothetical protein LCGC14_2853990, partial [marine sediment metagenome]
MTILKEVPNRQVRGLMAERLTRGELPGLKEALKGLERVSKERESNKTKTVGERYIEAREKLATLPSSYISTEEIGSIVDKINEALNSKPEENKMSLGASGAEVSTAGAPPVP